MSAQLQSVLPLSRKLEQSSDYEEVVKTRGRMLFLEKKASNARIVPFIVTSEHVDSDQDIDNIESIAKLIPEMLSSQRGVQMTVMHTDWIAGKVYKLEKSTIGEVAERYPKSADHLDLEKNKDVPCIYGEGRLYDDYPEMDDMIWEAIKASYDDPDKGLGAVSLRGFGTSKNKKVKDVEGNTGREIVGNKFWSVTLAPRGDQAKQYAIILEKMKSKEESNEESSNQTKQQTSQMEQPRADKMSTELEMPQGKTKDHEDDQSDTVKLECAECGHSNEVSADKIKTMYEKINDDDEEDAVEEAAKTKAGPDADYTLVRNDILDDLITAKEGQVQEQSKTKQQRKLESLYGDGSNGAITQTKLTATQLGNGASNGSNGSVSLSEEELEAKMVKLIKTNFADLGIKKSKTPDHSIDADNRETPEEEEIDAISIPMVKARYKAKFGREPTTQEIKSHVMGNEPLPEDDN